MIHAISPIDGRYAAATAPLQKYMSEYALIRYRLLVEVAYFKALVRIPLPQLAGLDHQNLTILDDLVAHFSDADAEEIKKIEKTTNHDVKAVEYYIKQKIKDTPLASYSEFIHFGLTSQDINNTAIPLMLRDAMDGVVTPALHIVKEKIQTFAREYEGIAMLARTHGQPASPTTVGKEFMVFAERLDNALNNLQSLPLYCKFGGATGNFNAHKVSYPDVNWPDFADHLAQSLGLVRHHYTTQIAHYDDLAAVFHSLSRINTILIDLCRDIWTYISMDYFSQKTIAGEVGSSAMPHKVNPIDFENAEGNFGMANALYGFLADKLPISRLQRDLTDSTVLRNIGVPLGHTLIGLKSLAKGLDKIYLNETALHHDLANNWAVVAEAIQTILRRELYPEPYEALKALTRGKPHIAQEDIVAFIEHLDIHDSVKAELKMITPWNYTGYV